VRRVNLLTPEFDGSRDHEGYRWRSAAIGRQLGAEKIGGSLYELGEGEKSFPYHFHHGMEEWGIVVSGSPTLRGPDGERELRRGDVVCFPPRPEGGHQLRGPGTVLMLSAQRPMEAIEYPESGKVAVSPPRKVFRMDDDVDYFEGEP
jgi:uncharacterized cupin superfamily protein